MFAAEYIKNKKSLFTDLLFGLAMGSFSLAILYECSLVNAAIVLMLQGFLGVATSVKLKQEIKVYISAVIYAIGMIQTIASPFDTFMSAAFVAHLILIGTFYYGMIKAKQMLQHFGKRVYSITLYGFMVLVFITITRIGELLSTNGSIISVSVSLFWMIYALILVWFGRNRRMNEILYAGLVVLVVTVGKLFFLDLPEVSMLIRAILFLLVGGLGIVISRMFFSKKNSSDKKAIHLGLLFYCFFSEILVLCKLNKKFVEKYLCNKLKSLPYFKERIYVYKSFIESISHSTFEGDAGVSIL